jgi:hypothetical protein
MMVEVFKTNVRNKIQAKQIADLLRLAFSDARINFDLGDCDKILRVEGINESNSPVIVADLNRLGFQCEVLN